jgi:hypothetical protein
MPKHHHHHSFHVHPNRPLDRGELEGLPALPFIPDEPDAADDDLPPAPRARPWSRYARWMAEAGTLVALLGILFSLVTHSVRVPGEAAFTCPPGTSQAVRLATACQVRDGDGDEQQPQEE